MITIYCMITAFFATFNVKKNATTMQQQFWMSLNMDDCNKLRLFSKLELSLFTTKLP